MANGPTPLISHGLPKTKNGAGYSPPTPPNISVEAIRRSLLHTPSPRRFKKLRVRRMQENLRRREDTPQLPLVDISQGMVGRGWGGDGEDDDDDDNRNCAVKLQCDEHVELDEIDLAVLNIGLDDEYDQPDGPLTQDQPLFYSTKLPLESPKRDTLDSYQRLRENDNTGNEACENLGKKQRGRKSRTRKKQPRRLPVDELVLTYERVAELHPPEDIDERGELSQDPISQLSSDDGGPRHHQPALRRPARANARKLFGDIDISKFRLPRPRDISPQARCGRERHTEYADGFEGEEAFPIGRPMPMSQRVRPQSRFNKTKALKVELLLVADRDFGLEDQGTHVSSPQRQLKKSPIVAEGEGLNRASLISIGPFLDDLGTRNVLENEEQELDLSDNPSIVSEIPTARTRSSPLVRKQSYMRKVRFNDMNEEGDMSQSSTMALPHAETGRLVRYYPSSKKAALQLSTPFSWNKSTQRTDDELDALQELAMVSVRKRIDSSDSEESSDVESMDSEDRAEMCLNPLEKDPGTPLPLDSGDEGDVEMDDDGNSQPTQPNSGQAEGDEIEDDSDGTQGYTHIESQASAYMDNDRKTLSGAKDIWRPHLPRTTRIAMEVDDDIINSPEVSRAVPRDLGNGYNHARRLSSIAGEALTLSQMPMVTVYDDQGSIELGNTQLLYRTPEPCIPETQMEDSTLGAEKDYSQDTFVPEDDYFTQASQDLDASLRHSSLVRLNSMPSSMRDFADEQEYDFPSGKTPEPQYSYDTVPRQGKNTRAFARHSSLHLSPITGGTAHRVMSLPFNPPFKR